jgi:protease-4
MKNPGWTFLGILKNIFFLLLFLQVLPVFITNIKRSIDDISEGKTEVGYLHLNGAIADSTVFIKRLQAFEMNKDIAGVIIKIESPGGLPGSSQAMLQEVVRIKEKKPVVAFIENIGASGAYYVAVGANKIVANPSSLVGSIGTIMKVPNVKELLDSWKVKNVFVQTGAYKTSLDPFKEIDPKEVAFLQTMSDDTYDQFITDVAAHRGLDKAQHATWANGKIFTARQGKELKLVDELGSFTTAVDAMATLLKTDRSSLKLISAQRGVRSFMQQLSGSDDEDFGTEMHASYARRLAQFCVSVYHEAALMVGSEQPTLQV